MAKDWHDEDDDGSWGKTRKKGGKNSWKRQLDRMPIDLITRDEDDLDDDEFEELENYRDRLKQ